MPLFGRRLINNVRTPVSDVSDFARLLLLVEPHQTYVEVGPLRVNTGRATKRSPEFALQLRKGLRALPVERELVVLGVMNGLAGIAEAVRDRSALLLLMLGKLRQCTPTLGRSLRKTLGCRIAGVLEGTFRTFGPSSICFYRMHDPTQHLIKRSVVRYDAAARVKKTITPATIKPSTEKRRPRSEHPA